MTHQEKGRRAVARGAAPGKAAAARSHARNAPLDGPHCLGVPASQGRLVAGELDGELGDGFA